MVKNGNNDKLAKKPRRRRVARRNVKTTPTTTTPGVTLTKAVDKEIDKRISQMVLSDKPKKLSSGAYYESLLFPETTLHARIPGMADACIPLHRKLSYTIQANALGAATIFCLPMTLCETSLALSTNYVNTNALFDGMTTVGASALATFITQNITSGSVGQYRLVSASMCVLPQSSMLNQSGSIHGAMMKIRGFAPATNGTIYGTSASFTLIPEMENAPYYNVASVSAQEGLRIIWMPNDLCELDFVNVNSNQFSNDQAMSANAMIATVVGASPNAPFRVDIYENFEVSPASGSVIMGMETIAEENIAPNLVWRDILKNHSHDVVIASRSVSSVARASISKTSDAIGVKNTDMTVAPYDYLKSLRDKMK
jgi:hypothetical protein